MDVTPDQKPVVVKDMFNLQSAHRTFQATGCGICGVTSPPDAEPGYRVEVHHLTRRSQGGGDEWANLFPACGEFLNGCHSALTRYAITIKRRDTGELIWADTRPGAPSGWQRCLYDPLTSNPPLAVGHHAVSGSAGLQPGDTADFDPPTRAASGAILGDVLPAIAEPRETAASLSLAASPQEERFAQIRSLLLSAERSRLAACSLLLMAFEGKEWEALGATWLDYYSGLNLQKSAVSKMLKVARTFRAAWHELPEHELAELSLERLYVAALLIDRGLLKQEDGLSEAVAQPLYQLRAKLTGNEPADRCMCRCPDCGAEAWHTRGAA